MEHVDGVFLVPCSCLRNRITSIVHQEDALLLATVDRIGPGEWTKVAKDVGSRTDNQCWRRWKIIDKKGLDEHRLKTSAIKKVLPNNFQGQRRTEKPQICAEDLLQLGLAHAQSPEIGGDPVPAGMSVRALYRLQSVVQHSCPSQGSVRDSGELPLGAERVLQTLQCFFIPLILTQGAQDFHNNASKQQPAQLASPIEGGTAPAPAPAPNQNADQSIRSDEDRPLVATATGTAGHYQNAPKRQKR